MDIQTISLLSGIATIITCLLSLNEEFRKNGIVHIMEVLLCYTIPILFIQPIITYSCALQEVFLWIYLFLLALITLSAYIKQRDYAHKLKLRDFLNCKIILIVSLILLSIVIPFFRDNIIDQFFLENFTYDKECFLQNLSEYKTDISMFNFLAENLFITLCVCSDVVILILIPISIYFFSEYTDERVNLIYKDGKAERLIFLRKKALKLSFFLFLFSSGFIYYLFYKLANFF